MKKTLEQYGWFQVPNRRQIFVHPLYLSHRIMYSLLCDWDHVAFAQCVGHGGDADLVPHLEEFHKKELDSGRLKKKGGGKVIKKMNPEAKVLILAALREPGARQTVGCLNDGYGMCCLGRICEAYRRVHPDTHWAGPNNYQQFLGQEIVLPVAVQEWAGVDEKNPVLVEPTVEGGQTITFAGANDALNWSFEEIAVVVDRDF